jgi:acyl-coenzyme A thioesterase PaaI-like protein
MEDYMTLFDMIKAQLGTAVPYATHTGVELLAVAPGAGSAALNQTPTSINHIGSQHGGALFTLGEAASGAAMAGTFADVLLSVRPVAAEATIKYLKIAKGRITAHAKTLEEADILTARLKADGKIKFDVAVSMMDEAAVEVATLQVGWHVRMM